MTDAASTLMAMKALKRIPKRQGLDVLARALAAARDYNADAEAPWLITRIFLFGSMLQPVDTVGDVDLVTEVRARYPDEDIDTLFCRERKRLEETAPSRIGSILATAQFEGPGRLQRVSPYVSVVCRMGMLDQLRERGEPCLLIYAHEKLPEADRGEAAANLARFSGTI